MGMISSAQHRCNALHVYCACKRMGMPDIKAWRVSRLVERFVHPLIYGGRMYMLLIAVGACCCAFAVLGAAIGGFFAAPLRGLGIGSAAGIIIAIAWLIWLMRGWRGGV